MPITFELAENITVFHASGVFCREELSQSIIECAERGFTEYKIYDFTDSGIPFSVDDIDKMADFIRNFSRKNNVEKKTAIVVSEDIDFGNARMVIALSELEIQHEISVFRSIEGAYAWLGLSP